MLRRSLGIGIVALAAGTLLGCATEPEPAWTEDEAYAAAEEVFREYWAVGDDEDPSTFLTAEMEDIDRKGDEELTEQGVEIRGETRIENFVPMGFRLVDDTAVVIATSCMNGDNIEVRTKGGVWHTPRANPRYVVEVEFESENQKMLVAGLTELKDRKCK